MLSKQPRDAAFINAVTPYSFYVLHTIVIANLLIHILHLVDEHGQDGCIRCM